MQTILTRIEGVLDTYSTPSERFCVLSSAPPWPGTNLVRAALLGLLMVAIGWAAMIPFWPYRQRLLDFGKIVDYNPFAFGIWVLGLLVWFAGLAIVCVSLRGVRFRDVRLSISVTSAAFLIAFGSLYPTTAIDPYIYTVRSYLFTRYGENPNATLPQAYWDEDPFVRFASRQWSDDPSPYGPLWNLIAAPVTWLSGSNIGIAIIGYKIMMVIAMLAIAWMIYDILARTAPQWALSGTIFWLWNPLVLWDGPGNAHNDLVMMVPVVAAIWTWQRGLHVLVVPLIVSAVAIKYVPMVLLLPAVIVTWRATRQPRTLLWSALLSAAVIIASLSPFFDLDALRDSAESQGSRFGPSLIWAASRGWRELTGKRLDLDLLRAIALAGVAIVVAVACARLWRHPEEFPGVSFEILFWFSVIGSTNQRPWYVLWLIPLAALLIPETPWMRAITWSMASMVWYVCQIYLWYVWNFDRYGQVPYQMVFVATGFLPPLIAGVIEWRVAGRVKFSDILWWRKGKKG